MKAKRICGKYGHKWEYSIDHKECTRCGKWRSYTPNINAIFRDGFKPRWKK